MAPAAGTLPDMVVPLKTPGDVTHLMGVQHIAMQNVASPDLKSMSVYRDYEFYANVVSGSIGPNLTIEYESDLRDHLQRMLDDVRAGRVFDLDDPDDRADLTTYKQTMFTVAQQNAELLVPAGEQYAAPAHPGREAMHRVLTDRWCLRNADRYNDQFQLGSVGTAMRGIDLTELARTDRDFADELAPGSEAADRLIGRLSESGGLSPDRVLDELNRQGADGKVERIAGWLLKTEPHDLPKTEVERVGAVLDQEFAAIRSGNGDRTGQALVGRLDHAVGKIVQDRQTMSVGLLPPATGTPTVATPRPVVGSRTTDPQTIVHDR